MKQERKERMDMFMMESGKEIKIGIWYSQEKERRLVKE